MCSKNRNDGTMSTNIRLEADNSGYYMVGYYNHINSATIGAIENLIELRNGTWDKITIEIKYNRQSVTPYRLSIRAQFENAHSAGEHEHCITCEYFDYGSNEERAERFSTDAEGWCYRRLMYTSAWNIACPYYENWVDAINRKRRTR